MAELTKLEEKLAEVIGLAMAAQGATEKVEKLVGNADLSRQLRAMRKQASEAEARGTTVAATFAGKKGAILKEARSVKKKANTASRTPNPLIDTGTICTARLIGTMTDAAITGNGTARLRAAQI